MHCCFHRSHTLVHVYECTLHLGIYILSMFGNIHPCTFQFCVYKFSALCNNLVFSLVISYFTSVLALIALELKFKMCKLCDVLLC